MNFSTHVRANIPRMPTKKQHAKSRKTNTFKTKGVKKGKKRNSKLFDSSRTSSVERKNVDVVSTFALPLTASFATPQLINGIAQGVANNERVGRKIRMKKIQIRYIVEPVSGSNPSQARIMIVYDKQPNGALPIVGDVVNGGQFYSFNVLANSDRFVVLMDEISESCQSSVTNISGQRHVNIDLETVFGGTTAGIASINSGSVFIMAANNSDPTVGTVSSMFFTTRVRYTDI